MMLLLGAKNKQYVVQASKIFVRILVSVQRSKKTISIRVSRLKFQILSGLCPREMSSLWIC
jgi:hypothetical protein